MNKRLLNLYSLKFNPFSGQVPASALWVPPPIQNFCWRIEHQLAEGGFALAMGDPGVGKSAALRILCEHLKSRGSEGAGAVGCEGRLAHPLRTLEEPARSVRRHLDPAPSQNGRLLPRIRPPLRRRSLPP